MEVNFEVFVRVKRQVKSMDNVIDHTPKDLHCISANYEILTTNKQKAIEEIKKIFEINQDVKSVSIRVTLRKD